MAAREKWTGDECSIPAAFFKDTSKARPGEAKNFGATRRGFNEKSTKFQAH
jgi:hypothetical protein